MQQRPVIGIPTQTLQSIDRIPEDLPESWVMNQRYFHACTTVGAIPWMVPLLDDDPETLATIARMGFSNPPRAMRNSPRSSRVTGTLL